MQISRLSGLPTKQSQIGLISLFSLLRARSQIAMTHLFET